MVVSLLLNKLNERTLHRRISIMKRVLFQGDSITDALRIREDGKNLGMGYASKVASKLGFEFPGEYEFINRGIGGNRIVDLYARIKSDIINLKPDYLSIMMGVNDVWHELNYKNGVDIKKFEMIYDMLISEIFEALPNVKIMLLEPYVLPEFATIGELEDGRDKYTVFRESVEKYALATKKIAEKYNLKFIPIQEGFDKLVKTIPVSYWSEDGVHPTPVGHEFIAREWIKKFQED